MKQHWQRIEDELDSPEMSRRAGRSALRAAGRSRAAGFTWARAAAQLAALADAIPNAVNLSRWGDAGPAPTVCRVPPASPKRDEGYGLHLNASAIIGAT